MKRVLSGISVFSVYGIYTVFSLIIAVVLLNFLLEPGRYGNGFVYLAGLLLAMIFGVLFFGFMARLFSRYNEWKVVLFLVTVCFAVKFSWIWFFRIEPAVDYATFYYTAVDLSNQFVIGNRYVALFPHIFGYAFFLSLFMKLFGTSSFLPPVLNVILSMVALVFIYLIGKRTAGKKVGIAAGLLWIVFPSQTVYNMFALSEPLYTTILLAVLYIMILTGERIRRMHPVKLGLWGVFLALLLAWLNVCRPVALIPMIALFIWLFVIDLKHFSGRGILYNKLLYFSVTVILFTVFTSLANKYISVRIGEEIATIPGYNLYVGFNEKSSGTWNQDEADLLFYYNDHFLEWTADDVQRQMLKEAKKRIKGGISFGELFLQKLIIFLGNDRGAVGYASTVLDEEFRTVLAWLSDGFYYVLLTLSLAGAAAVLKRNPRSAVVLAVLYAIGLTLAHMLVEVAVRYHYSLTVTFVILAAAGIVQLFGKFPVPRLR